MEAEISFFEREDLRKLAGVLHTLSCTKKHANEMSDLLLPENERDKEVCFFYLEESLVEEERFEHKKWEGIAEELCQKNNTSPDVILRILPSLLECRQKIMRILERAPNSVELCHLVVFSEI